MSFADKVILITGGNSGIGADCAEYFAKEGAKLALCGRNAAKFETVIGQIKESGVELEPLVILADVSTDAERIMAETIEKYERLDILINMAGFAIFDSLDTMNMEDYDSMIATNVRGPVELTKLAIPHLLETKGNIINVSSGLATIAIPHAIAYAVSKALVEQFTKCVAIDPSIAGKIRVNCISPGVVATEFHGGSSGLTDEEYNARFIDYCQMHPIQRIGTKADCVNAISFLADDDKASFITGTILPIDGGLSIKGVF